MSKFTAHVLTAVTLVVVFTFAAVPAQAGHHGRGHHGKKFNVHGHGQFRSHQFHGHKFHKPNFHVNKFHNKFMPKPLVFGFNGHHFG